TPGGSTGSRGEADAPPPVARIGARKRYGQVEALRGVDLVIRPGEVVAMLGPNGAGKTTSISLMLGLRQPTAGQVRLFGLPPTDRRARSRCGVMLQESGTTAVLTVAEIVDLFRAYYPAPLPAERAIAMAGLTEPARTRSCTSASPTSRGRPPPSGPSRWPASPSRPARGWARSRAGSASGSTSRS